MARPAGREADGRSLEEVPDVVARTSEDMPWQVMSYHTKKLERRMDSLGNFAADNALEDSVGALKHLLDGLGPLKASDRIAAAVEHGLQLLVERGDDRSMRDQVSHQA